MRRKCVNDPILFLQFCDHPRPFEKVLVLHLNKLEFPSSDWGNLNVAIQNSKVNNVYNVTIVQKAITKSSVGQNGPPTNAKVGSGA
jgi:hypothetical protein